VATSTILAAIKALYHAICWTVASCRGDKDTKAIEFQKLQEIPSFDNLCRIVASLLAGQAISYATASCASDGMAVAVTIVMYAVAIGLTKSLLALKNSAGGWIPWLMSSLMRDRRPKVWTGELFDEYQADITDSLRCTITRVIV
jgi:hypothetical protein